MKIPVNIYQKNASKSLNSVGLDNMNNGLPTELLPMHLVSSFLCLTCLGNCAGSGGFPCHGFLLLGVFFLPPPQKKKTTGNNHMPQNENMLYVYILYYLYINI